MKIKESGLFESEKEGFYQSKISELEEKVEDLKNDLSSLKKVVPDLWAVINWLNAGCDPKDAAKELIHYQERIDKAKQG